ncbi:hypothetical protein N0V93_005194 [Gnomoniopsis smithogilvyi]|uniref:Uncharacterized protein n=1 Tax=Gnomoniopsis smithogilvyi TaxID=1191159 RepID=A0A9W8YU41_9PEZI|nr:hypothetical protein N0V93_005194 [Gnomoniopsis smithogilvyi]
MATNGNGIHQEQYGAAPQADAPSTTDPSATASHSKDEVGWYFVQQYYTTLSKNTSKLHLFYNKQSQFVQGPEAELVDVSVGRQDIQEAIKQLDFQDCKVRVSNVDSQASFNNIVIQVIGEISNKGAEPKKFVQTFVLAQQPAGYFLLNDIMRYINEGEEENVEGTGEEAAAAPVSEAEAPQELAAEAEAEKAETEVATDAALDTQAVDQKLEEAASVSKEAPATSAVEPAAEPAPAAQEATPSKPEVADATPESEKIAQEIAEEETKKPDVPKEPSPTPAPARAPAAEPEKPKEPPKPMSWASRVAAAAGSAAPKPVVPLPAKTPAAPAQPAQSRPAAAPATAQPTAPAQPANKENSKENKETKEESEWRMADSKRQSRQHSVAPTPEKDGTLAYVKFVTDKVKDDELRAALSSHGELVYFDINRSKNCAFVEYGSTTACQSAIKASPITIAGDNIVIEPRRPKAGAYGGANYNQNRGSISGRGRGGFEGNRSGSQGGGRGGFANRGRGGAPRGRGGVQTTNA